MSIDGQSSSRLQLKGVELCWLICCYCCSLLDKQAKTEILQNVQLVPCIGRLKKVPQILALHLWPFIDCTFVLQKVPVVKEEDEPEEEDEEEMGHAETYAEYMPIKCTSLGFVRMKAWVPLKLGCLLNN